MRITWNNREKALEQLDRASCVRFAVFCAEQVKHLNDDPAVDAAIDAAKVWLASPSEENASAANAAAYVAARTAVHTAARTAAYAAARTAVHTAANDASAARAVACAAYAAAYAAKAAAYATDINKEQIKQEQVNYLKQLYLESLPEDERNCWLVQAAIGV